MQATSRAVTLRHTAGKNLSCVCAIMTTHASAPGARVVTPPVITNLSVGVEPSGFIPRLTQCGGLQREPANAPERRVGLEGRHGSTLKSRRDFQGARS